MVFVSAMAGHPAYGTLPGAGQSAVVTRRGPRVIVALAATVVVAVACLGLVAFEASSESKRFTLVQRVSDGFLFKTPTLKSLVGTFMTEQGASKNDIAEVDHYYSSKKAARIQMLNDLSSEFDPFTDADSNYGRVLSLKGISRTNGPVGEDMDTSGEYKARVQSLAWKPSSEVISAAFQPVIDAITQKNSRSSDENMDSAVAQNADMPKSEVGLSDAGVFGTDKVYMGQADGAGQSTKAATQKLWGDKEEKELDLQSDRRPFLRDARQFRKANKAWLNAKPHYWNKATKAQMLDELSRTHNALPKAVHARKAQAARAQQLYSLPAQFHDTAPTGVAPLPDAGAAGTNAAFLYSKMDKDGRWYEGMGDGAGQSTKGRVQMLLQPARFTAKGVEYAPLPEAGPLGTDVTFLKKDTAPKA